MAQNNSDFMRLYLKVEPSIRSYLLALLRNADDMEDVFQETSMVLWQRFDEYDRERPFLSWATGIARNHAARWRRSRRRKQVWLSPEVEQRLAETYCDLEEDLTRRRETLGLCLEKLGTRAKDLLALRYEKSCSLQDIASAQQISLNAVNKMLGRIRHFLFECTSLAERRAANGMGGALR